VPPPHDPVSVSVPGEVGEGSTDRGSGRLVDRYGLALAAGSAGLATVVLVAQTVIAVARAGGPSELLVAVLGAGAMLAFAWVGVVIVRTRRRHLVGWTCVVGGLFAALSGLGETYLDGAELPAEGTAADVAVVLSNLFGLPTFVLFVLFLPLLFPSGRLPSRAWRPVLLGLVVITVAQTLLTALEPGPVVWEGIVVVGSNPLGTPIGRLGPLVQSFGEVASIPLILAAFALLVQRIRRADRLERLQIKWAGSALAVLVGSVIMSSFPALHWLTDLLMPGALLLVPLAIGVAITRHGLYEIDRIISRTVAYACAVLLLVGIYTLSVLGLGTIVRTVAGESGDLVVAVSTLLTAAAFRPVTRRLRDVVDRRFNRRRYDAQQMVEGFSRTVRDEMDLEAVVHGLQDTVASTLYPTTTTVMLVGRRA
jgi:hypothetical protein